MTKGELREMGICRGSLSLRLFVEDGMQWGRNYVQLLILESSAKKVKLLWEILYDVSSLSIP